ncbi:hypothetical protein IP69_19545 [Bosea sp. AAP35]|uniref:hypothetical protein n=1 Tax=Bosea sp. AAP35 TaxID=1523417 RepID=UPI0006B96FEA|nr:hypothetical protein [Bosea sp. AAP35]KPF63190.1 hypothetical protein IP69_19545 [Bosea sp. AAP35]
MSHSKPTESDTTDANPAKESLLQEQQEQRELIAEHGEDALLNKALEDTFPASDPIATQTPIKPGASDSEAEKSE